MLGFLLVVAVVERSLAALAAFVVAAVVLRWLLRRLRSAMTRGLLAVPDGAAPPSRDTGRAAGADERRRRYPSMRDRRHLGARLSARAVSSAFTLVMALLILVSGAIVPLVGAVLAPRSSSRG